MKFAKFIIGFLLFVLSFGSILSMLAKSEKDKYIIINSDNDNDIIY